MSTLFRRLAAQQLGMPAPRIRPLASLPYQSAPAFIDPLATDASTAPAIVPDPASPTTSSPPRSTGHPTFDDPPQVLAPLTETLTGAEDTPSGRHQTVAEDTATPAGATDVQAMPRRPIAPSPRQPSAKPAHRSREVAAEFHTGASGDTGDTMPDALLPTARHQDAPMASPPPLIPAFHPALDLPSKPSVARPTAPRPASNTARHTPEAAPDEIHVHIGRIEVTAVQEAPKPKARAARGQAPMSLDDYLAKRQRGGA